MNASQHVVFLTLRVFSLTGGIEKVCRCLAKVLNDTPQLVGSYKMLSLCDSNKQVDERYLSKNCFEGYSGSKPAYFFAALKQAFRAETLILSHINLLAIAWLVKLFKPKAHIILFAHGIEVWRYLPRWKRKVLKRITIWAVSDYTAKTLILDHQVPAKNVSILNNCLDPFLKPIAELSKPQFLLQRYGLKPNQPVIFTLSRLVSTELYKGYDLVTQTIPSLLTKFPDLTYLIAGKSDEQEKKRMEDLIAAHKLQKNVKLLGFIDDKELEAHFTLADVFVMPSRKEGFGIVFIEAAACGCPVVAGNQDGSVDALLKGKLGELVNPCDVEEIEMAIGNLLAKPRLATERQARQALCLANFSFEKYKEKVLALLLPKQLVS